MLAVAAWRQRGCTLPTSSILGRLPIAHLSHPVPAFIKMIDAVSAFLGKNNSRAKKYIAIIEEMLDGGEYHYAEETLEGILADITKEERITDAQAQAVKNIRRNPSDTPYGFDESEMFDNF